MKIILIVIDGLGDKPIKALENKTPLEAAKTPNLDWLAKNGICGSVLPFVRKGKLPTSEDTHLALFGYNPEISNPGRGVLEVLGIGLKILPGDVCLRGNFATVSPEKKSKIFNGASEKLKIIDRRAERIGKTERLIKAISGIKIKGVRFFIKEILSHRIGIVMHGKNLSSDISDGDPKISGVKPLKILPKEKSSKAIFTAKILNQFLEKTHLILKDHPFNLKRKSPANYILVRGAGKFRKIKSFGKKYGLKPAFVVGGALYRGIGRFLGMAELKAKGANALSSTNLKEKILTAKKALKKHNFVFLHIKAADNLAEDGNFQGKKEFIEKIDKNLKPLLGLKNTLIVVTADHSTCSLKKSHCKEPVQLLIYEGKIKKDRTVKFSEKLCEGGKLGKIKQISLMKKILEFKNY